MPWETVLVDGVDLSTIATIEDMAGVLASAPTSGDPIDIPGRQGAVFVPGEYESYSFDVPLAIIGETSGELNANLATLLALIDTRTAPVTVTRRITVGTATVADSCSCVVTGTVQPSTAGRRALRMVVSFQNLDGDWTSVAES